MNPATMRLLRQIHTYLGVFFAPAIIFFAFSGVLQTFSLHESKGDVPYRPPSWIVTLASVHKDQALPRPSKPRPVAPKSAAPAPAQPHADAATAGAPEQHRPPSPLPLKIFVLLLSTGLIATALIGIYIALKNAKMRRNVLIALAAGGALPILLLLV